MLLLMLSWSTWEYIIGATLYFRSTFALKSQRIVDCSQTMSVLCSPTNSTYSHCSANYPIYPLSLIVISPLLFFPANLSESQCFQTKHKSRRRKLKKLRWHWCWVRGPANLTPPTLSILPHQEHHCHPLWQVEPAPGFPDSHLGGLRPCGRPGPTAAVWLICVKMARSAPKPAPRSILQMGRLLWTLGHCLPLSSPRLFTRKAFSLLEPLPTLFQEKHPLRRICKLTNSHGTSKNRDNLGTMVQLW